MRLQPTPDSELICPAAPSRRKAVVHFAIMLAAGLAILCAVLAFGRWQSQLPWGGAACPWPDTLSTVDLNGDCPNFRPGDCPNFRPSENGTVPFNAPFYAWQAPAGVYGPKCANHGTTGALDGIQICQRNEGDCPNFRPSENGTVPFNIHAAAKTGTVPANIQLCQALGPAAPNNICAVDCATCRSGRNCRCRGWEAARLIAWQAYAQGEYVGHERTAHVPEYRLRVDDNLDLIYRLTREETAKPYKLNVGDEIRIESFTDSELNRDLILQPDGTITLRLLGQVHATGRTVTQLRDALEESYKKYYKVPAITVTPLKVNTKLEDLRATVDRRAGLGGQSQLVRVTPEGTISLPAIGSMQAQGLTLTELQEELNQRYHVDIEGIEVIPVLVQRAPRYVYVLGEVRNPGRFELTGPTTALQALSMAGSWNVGANLKQIVVFRRGDDWRLLATMIDLDGALHGRTPCPAGEIWLSDSDVIIVPKGQILQADDFINLVFTRGIYGVLPLNASLNFSKLSTL